MKYTNFSAFEKHVQHAAPNHFAPLYLLIAADDFERQKAENLLRREILGKKHPPYAFVSREAEAFTLQELVNELSSGDMFTPRRIVLIQHLEGLKKAQKEHLENYFANPAPNICVICSAVSFNRGTTFYKKAEKAGVIFDVEEKKPWELEKLWIEQVAAAIQAEGKTIEHGAAHLLVKQVGSSSALLHQEIEKLMCYGGNRAAVTVKDIQAVCVKASLETIWQLGDAIFQREAALALRIGLALLEEGTPFLILLRQIRSQFQTKFQLCSIHASGGTLADITAQFPYMKGAVLDKNLAMAREYGLARFKQGMILIDAFELEAKNGSADSAYLAERLLIKLTTI
ncbi:MAG: DNA polymerase III subunit delta [Parachlamydia sp.]|nr:MAG: DNA polymerase III subunit delta [Parachlamydia sp.]